MLAYVCCVQKDENVNQEILDNIATAKKTKAQGTEFKYEDKDVILYNLGVGAKKTELPLVLYVLVFSSFSREPS
jgi:multifunctional beta-oxidation protein